MTASLAFVLLALSRNTLRCGSLPALAFALRRLPPSSAFVSSHHASSHLCPSPSIFWVYRPFRVAAGFHSAQPSYARHLTFCASLLAGFRSFTTWVVALIDSTISFLCFHHLFACPFYLLSPTRHNDNLTLLRYHLQLPRKRPSIAPSWTLQHPGSSCSVESSIISRQWSVYTPT